ncbi:MAG: bifunctional diguanylate cyclase/phosphodiesterase, partial [Burkholderiaceae bacterium]
DQDFFRIHIENPNHSTLYIGGPMVGPASGKRVFLVSRRVSGMDGQFLGVVVASVSTDALARKFATELIGDHGIVNLVHIPSRKILVRQPEYERTFGEKLKYGRIFDELEKAPTGSFKSPSTFDNELYFFVYRQLADTPLAVTVGMSISEINGQLAHDLSDYWIVVVLLTIAIAAAAGVILAAHRRQLHIQMNLDSSEVRFRTLSEVSTVGIFHTNSEGDCIYVNEQWSKITGLSLADALGKGWLTAVHPDDAPQVEAHWNQFVKTHTPFLFEYRFLRPNGETCWVLGRAREEIDKNGLVTAYAGTVTDITEHKRAEDEMRLASTVYQTTSEAMMVTDVNNTIINVNPAFLKMTGYQMEEVIGQTPRLLHSGRQDRAFYQTMWQDIIATGKWQGEVWNRHKDGNVFPIWLTINTTSNEDPASIRRVALLNDMTEKKKSQEVIWRQANIDTLTGLPNRLMFMDRLEQEIKKTHRTDLPLALFFLDLDRFKEVNDSLGHDMGDILLQETARRLTSCVRETDTVARLGGDEFTIIMGEIEDPVRVERIAQEILRKLSAPFHLNNEIAYVTTSIGITYYPQDADSMDVLIKHADQSMYAAKNQGRNRYRFFTHAMQDAVETKTRLANDLRGALAEHQLRVYYQPIVNLSTGEIVKAEALIRWQHPTRGLVSPVDFIPIAEDTGLIIGIGDWVFSEAAHQVAKWRKLYQKQFQISVNKSAVQFHSDSTCHVTWPLYLQGLELSGDSIAVEITESSLLEASTSVMDRIIGFHDAGMQVSLDDFGTGFSSLSYLKKFDIDYLKIDRSFVHNLTRDSNDMALCEAIIVMSHKLGIKVIAEGVETIEQRDLLAAAGCDFAQGYLYSRPVPADDFEELFLRRTGTVVT